MAYGTLKVDNITFTNSGVDQTITVSGIVRSISGNITVTGTVQAQTVIGVTVSGGTVTGDAGAFGTLTGNTAGFTTITGTTVTGTSANFVSGIFTGSVSGTVVRGSTVSGAVVTGDAGQFAVITGSTAGFTTVTGGTVTGTTANFVNGSFSNQISGATVRGTTVSGATVTGTAGQFGTLTGNTAGFTTVTGTTVTGSIANFVSGVFTAQISGATITGNLAQFTTLTGNTAGFTTVTGTTVTGTTANFATISGTTITGGAVTVASGVYTGNVTAAAFIPTGSTAPTNGLYLPSANSVALSTNGTGRLFVDASGNVGIGAATPVNSANYSSLTLQGTTGGQIALRAGTTLKSYFFNDASKTTIGAVDDFVVATTGSITERLRITSAGLVGIGTSSPTGGVDVASGGLSLILGADANATTRTNATNKQSRIGGFHYTNAEEPIAIATTISTATGGSLYFGGGTSSMNAATEIQFYTAANNTTTTGTARMAIDSSGRVGIGTTSPSQELDILADKNGFTTSWTRNPNTGSSAGARVLVGSHLGDVSLAAYSAANTTFGGSTAVLSSSSTFTGGLHLFAGGAAPLVFWTNSSERGRWDSSGRLLVGTTSARSNLPFAFSNSAARLQVEGAGEGQGAFAVIQNYDSATTGVPAVFNLARSGATSIGSNTIVASGNRLGEIQFSGSDGTNFIQAAVIRGEVDGTPGTDDMPGRLVFSTTADGAASPTERLRIDSTGQIEAGSLGTAAAPVWSFLNDPNTGIYSPGADQLALSTNGQGRLFIDASGNVGVSAAPTYRFDVSNGGASAAAVRILGNDQSNVRLRLQNSGSGGRAYEIVGGSNAANNSHFTIYDATAAATRLAISDTGLVGVGTASPSQLLHVRGNALVTGSGGWTTNEEANIYLGDIYGSLSYDFNTTNLKTKSFGSISFLTGGTSPTERLRITSTGQLSHIGAGSSGSPAVSFSGSAASNSLVVDSSSRVGVGTSSPGSILDIRQDTLPRITLVKNGIVSWYIGNPAQSTSNNFSIGTDSGGNTNILNITGGGLVGIGTSTPDSALNVRSTASATNPAVRIASSGSLANNIIFRCQINGLTNGMSMTQDASSNVLYTFEGGRVGIGTTTVNRQLVLNDNTLACLALQNSTTGNATGDGFQIQLSGTDAYIWNYETAPIAFGTNNQERLRIDSTGQIFVAATAVSGDSLNANGLRFAGGSIKQQSTVGFDFTQFYTSAGQASPDASIFIPSSNAFGIKTSANERLRITSTGQLSHIGAGSSGSPAVAFNGSAPSNSLVIDSSGRVGIGTSPITALHVYGASAQIRVESSTGTDGNVRFINTSGSMQIGLTGAGGNTFLLYDNTNGALAYQYAGAASAGTHTWFTNNTERLRITSAGLVGIGTSTPWSTLTVGSGGTANPAADATIHASSIDQYRLKLTSVNFNADTKWLGLGFGYSDNYMKVGILAEAKDANARANLHFCLNNAASSANASLSDSRMVITSAGLVGIGTTSASANLTVNGSAATTAHGIHILRNGYTAIGRLGYQSTDGSQLWLTNNYNPTTGAADSAEGGSLNFASNGETRFFTANNERARIDSSGRLGIGTTSPLTPLHVNASSGIVYTTIGNGNGGTQIGVDSSGLSVVSAFANNAIRFGNSSGSTFAETMRLDASGRLLVGTSSARSNFFNTSTFSPGIQLEGATDQNRLLSIVSSNISGAGGVLVLASQKSGAVGGNTIVDNGGQLGLVSFQGNDNTEFVEAARIQAEVDGTPGANDMPGRLVFSTTADGAASPTERMRIGSNGSARFNTTGGDGASVVISNNIASTYGLSVYDLANSGWIARFYDNSSVIAGSITRSGAAVAYNTSSDYRLKENVVAVTDGITRLQQLKPSRFNFIADPAKTVDGFLAHEVQTIVPEAITGEKDAVDDEGNPQYQGIDQSKLVPLLTAALQEAIAKIESLEARLDAANL